MALKLDWKIVSSKIKITKIKEKENIFKERKVWWIWPPPFFSLFEWKEISPWYVIGYSRDKTNPWAYEWLLDKFKIW